MAGIILDILPETHKIEFMNIIHLKADGLGIKDLGHWFTQRNFLQKRKLLKENNR